MIFERSVPDSKNPGQGNARGAIPARDPVCQASNLYGHRLFVLIRTDLGLLPLSLRRGRFVGEFSVGLGMLEIVKGGRQAAVHIDLPVEGVQVGLHRIF